jgi:hypothetical protein
MQTFKASRVRNDLWIPKNDWKLYEAYIFGLIQSRFPHAIVEPNQYIRGIRSNRLRQIDILVKQNLGGFDLRIVFDCKCYTRKVTVKDVEAFIGMLEDIRVSKGVLVTTKGYSKAAYERAKTDSRDLDLKIISPERLSEYQYIGCAFPWKGPVAAIVSHPNGWVVDNEDTHNRRGCQFSMYPLGHSRESAKKMCPFVYGNIILKNDLEPTIESIATRHEKTILEKFPAAKLETLPSPFQNSLEKGDAPRVLYRKADIDVSFGGPEYSLYLDNPKGVLLLVLLCPTGMDKVYVPVLEWIAGGAILMHKTDEDIAVLEGAKA